MRSLVRAFDKIRDMSEVEQFGYVNLAHSYVSGAIDGHINPDVSAMNNIENPESIIGKPSDEFDAIALQKVIRERGVKSPDTPSPQEPKGSE